MEESDNSGSEREDKDIRGE